MKKVIRNGVLMLGLTATMASYATGVADTLVTTDNKKTTLTLKQVKKGHLLIIKNANGVVLYKERIQDAGEYAKDFDLTALPDGDYVFELEKDVEIRSIPFKVASNQVVFDKASEAVIYKPVVSKRGDLVYISRFSFTEKPLQYKIYYADNNDVVASEKFKDDEAVEKIYNFSEARPGTYKIVFKSEGRVFIQKVKV